MAWPSLYLFISTGAFSLAIAGALILQFFSKDPRTGVVSGVVAASYWELDASRFMP